LPERKSHSKYAIHNALSGSEGTLSSGLSQRLSLARNPDGSEGEFQPRPFPKETGTGAAYVRGVGVREGRVDRMNGGSRLAFLRDDVRVFDG